MLHIFPVAKNNCFRLLYLFLSYMVSEELGYTSKMSKKSYVSQFMCNAATKKQKDGKR